MYTFIIYFYYFEYVWCTIIQISDCVFFCVNRFVYPEAPVSTSTRKIELKRTVIDKVKPAKSAEPLKAPSLDDEIDFLSFPSDTASTAAASLTEKEMDPEPEIVPRTLLEAFPAGSEVSFQVLSIKASKLRNVELLGKNDPFVILNLKTPGSWSGKTSILDSGGSDVEWTNLEKDASMQFLLRAGDLTSSVLEVQVKDSNSFRSDVLIGAGEMTLSEGTYEHIHRHVGLLYVTASLKEKAGKFSGTVAVSLKLTKRE